MILHPIVLKVGEHNMKTVRKVEKMGRVKKVEKIERVRRVEEAIREIKKTW